MSTEPFIVPGKLGELQLAVRAAKERGHIHLATQTAPGGGLQVVNVVPRPGKRGTCDVHKVGQPMTLTATIDYIKALP